jgi:hypothetical protein
MLLLLPILIIWLAVVAVTVILCKAAAHGDAQRARAMHTAGAPRRLAPGLIVWDATCGGTRTRRASRFRHVPRRRHKFAAP